MSVRNSSLGPKALPWSAAALAAVLAAVGCGAGAPTDGSSHEGGALVIGQALDPECVDPQQTTLAPSLHIGRSLVDSLTDQDPETGEIIPWIAESWKVNEDATEFTFKLREGATFSDGAPVDAQAVVANLDGVEELGARAVLGSGYLDGYEGAEAVDASTVRVAFSSPSVQFLQATATESLGLLAPASFDASPEERCQGSFTGSGPFELEEFTPNAQTVLTRRDGYDWPSAVSTHKGAALVERVEFRTVPEDATRTGLLQSGEIGAAGLSVYDEERFSGNGFSTLFATTPGYVASLQFNHEDPVLKDVRVRRALLKGIDRKDVARTLGASDSRPATSVLAHNTPGYTELGAELAYDPDGAEKLLDEAGWTRTGDDVREKDGEPLTLEAIDFLPPANLELAQQQLARIGVKLSVRELAQGEFQQALNDGDFQISRTNQTRADGDVLRAVFSTAGGNRLRVPESGLDTVLREQAGLIDADEREPSLAEAQRIIVEQAHVAPLNEVSWLFGVADHVRDLRFTASARLHLHDVRLAE